MKLVYFFILTVIILPGCSSLTKRHSTPIFYAGGKTGLGHMLKVKALVSGIETELIFDTGIGVNLISQSFCNSLNCKVSGSVTGKRMSGQSVTIPMSTVQSLEVAGLKDTTVEVGVLDLDSFLPKTKEFKNVQGYLSLNFFKERPFTVDYKRKLLIFETKESLAKRLKNSKPLEIIKKFEGSALTIQVYVEAQTRKPLKMQLDLGTNIVTISNKYKKELEKYFIKSTSKKESMIDETNFKRDRLFIKLKNQINLLGNGAVYQKTPTAMFQKIIYDGVIGNDFFKNRVVTYDLKNSQLIIQN